MPKGVRRPPEVIAKIRAGNIGQKRTPEQREKMRLKALERGPRSDATREKMKRSALARWAKIRAAKTNP